MRAVCLHAYAYTQHFDLMHGFLVRLTNIGLNGGRSPFKSLIEKIVVGCPFGVVLINTNYVFAYEKDSV